MITSYFAQNLLMVNPSLATTINSINHPIFHLIFLELNTNQKGM